MVEINQEDVALVALLHASKQPWTQIASRILSAGSAEAVLQTEMGNPDPRDDWGRDYAETLALFPEPPSTAYVRQLEQAVTQAKILLEQWHQQKLRFVSVLNAQYPAQLREVYDLPPFLFVDGTLRDHDRAVSVVGSRHASDQGVLFARDTAAMLVERGLTVIAGGAAGIDAAAHQSALDMGGRTVAFLGTGITRRYPAQNAQLQNRIAEQGALFSQFWPEQAPTKWTFPQRNATMSGYGAASVIVEAGEYSGTRIQARQAQAHGRPIILRDTVVKNTSWAKQLKGKPGVYIAHNVDEVAQWLDKIEQQDRLLQSLLAV